MHIQNDVIVEFEFCTVHFSCLARVPRRYYLSKYFFLFSFSRSNVVSLRIPFHVSNFWSVKTIQAFGRGQTRMNFSNTSFDPVWLQCQTLAKRKRERAGGRRSASPLARSDLLFSWHAFAIEAILASVAKCQSPDWAKKIDIEHRFRIRSFTWTMSQVIWKE